jgi:hypothetical protein
MSHRRHAWNVGKLHARYSLGPQTTLIGTRRAVPETAET